MGMPKTRMSSYAQKCDVVYAFEEVVGNTDGAVFNGLTLNAMNTGDAEYTDDHQKLCYDVECCL